MIVRLSMSLHRNTD